ncbi:class A sortase [Enterococcus alishanensis]
MKIKLLKIIGVLIILVGLLFLASKPLKNYSIEHTGKKYGIEKVTKKELEKNEATEVNFDFDQVQPLDTASVAAAQARQLSGDELPVIASVAIPSVAVRLPVFKGLSNDNLLYGAGTVSANQEIGTGNYALASHRSDQAALLFTPIENMSTGEQIYLTDLEKVYVYTVYSVKKVAPTSVEILDYQPGSTPMITLFTCGDLYARSRIVVQGSLTTEVPMADMTDEMANAFKLDKNSY